MDKRKISDLFEAVTAEELENEVENLEKQHFFRGSVLASFVLAGAVILEMYFDSLLHGVLSGFGFFAIAFSVEIVWRKFYDPVLDAQLLVCFQPTGTFLYRYKPSDHDVVVSALDQNQLLLAVNRFTGVVKDRFPSVSWHQDVKRKSLHLLRDWTRCRPLSNGTFAVETICAPMCEVNPVHIRGALDVLFKVWFEYTFSSQRANIERDVVDCFSFPSTLMVAEKMLHSALVHLERLKILHGEVEDAHKMWGNAFFKRWHRDVEESFEQAKKFLGRTRQGGTIVDAECARFFVQHVQQLLRSDQEFPFSEGEFRDRRTESRKKIERLMGGEIDFEAELETLAKKIKSFEERNTSINASKKRRRS